MAELDQAPPDTGPATATRTADTEPHADRQPGSRHDQPVHPHRTAADTDPAWYDRDIGTALAADTTPTRQQAARQDSNADGQATPDRDTGPDGAADIAAITGEDASLTDTRTRQQAARDDTASSSAAAATTPLPPPAGNPNPCPTR